MAIVTEEVIPPVPPPPPEVQYHLTLTRQEAVALRFVLGTGISGNSLDQVGLRLLYKLLSEFDRTDPYRQQPFTCSTMGILRKV